MERRQPTCETPGAQNLRKQVPLDPPMLPFAVGGTAVWVVAGLAMLPFHDRLADAGHGSWLGVCLAGALLGIPGTLTMIRHDAKRQQRMAARKTRADQPPAVGSTDGSAEESTVDPASAAGTGSTSPSS